MIVGYALDLSLCLCSKSKENKVKTKMKQGILTLLANKAQITNKEANKGRPFCHELIGADLVRRG